eukprot:705388-Alexandrium_andersonii.AAC.1
MSPRGTRKAQASWQTANQTLVGRGPTPTNREKRAEQLRTEHTMQGQACDQPPGRLLDRPTQGSPTRRALAQAHEQAHARARKRPRCIAQALDYACAHSRCDGDVRKKQEWVGIPKTCARRKHRQQASSPNSGREASTQRKRKQRDGGNEEV